MDDPIEPLDDIILNMIKRANEAKAIGGMTFKSLPVCVTPMAVYQFRFPRTKNRRKRNKWTKKECNLKPTSFRIGNIVYVHPEIVGQNLK